jgi:hypothetical protein
MVLIIPFVRDENQILDATEMLERYHGKIYKHCKTDHSGKKVQQRGERVRFPLLKMVIRK